MIPIHECSGGSTSLSDEEEKCKVSFANKYYDIPIKNIYYVEKDIQKKEKLMKIKENYPKLDDKYIIMIDNIVSILNDVMENTNFSTTHISSFLDI